MGNEFIAGNIKAYTYMQNHSPMEEELDAQLEQQGGTET
jgi:hypothetical protein